MQPSVASPPLGVSVTAAVLSENAETVTASLHFTAPAGGNLPLTVQSVSMNIDSLPAGVSLQMLPIGSDGGGLTVPLSVRGSSSATQGDAWLKVHLNGQTQVVRLPVLRASSVALPAVPAAQGRPFQVAASAPCGQDMLLSAPVNAPLEQRARLLRFTPQTGAFQGYDLGLAPTEGVTSQLCDPGGLIWLTIRSDDTQGSVIARLDPASGLLTRFPVGAVADTLNNLTRSADGRLWFVQYGRDRLGEFDPLTGRVVTHTVAENAENLRLGQDGALYYSQFYAHPAVVRVDPQSGESRVLSVGNSGKNLPRASVQTGGFVWYTDAYTLTLNRLDPLNGLITPVQLPAGAVPGELVASASGTLWAADAARHVLYRLESGSPEAVTVPLTGGGTDGPRALSVGADGALWYESGGQLIRQQ